MARTRLTDLPRPQQPEVSGYALATSFTSASLNRSTLSGTSLSSGSLALVRTGALGRVGGLAGPGRVAFVDNGKGI